MEDRYFVQMPDGSKYGPADLATLKEWAAGGRLQASSMLVSERTGESVRADSLEGLFDAVAGPPPVLPPAGAYPGAAAFGPLAAPRKSNTTLVLLLVFGGLGLCIVPMFAAILFPVFAQARLAGKRTVGLSNMKRLGMGVLMYANDADDHFPLGMTSAERLRPALMPYVQDGAPFKSVNPDGGEILSDDRLSGRNSTNVAKPYESVLFFDRLGWSGGRSPVAFADGSARTVAYPTIASLMAPDPFGGLTREKERKQDSAK